MFFFPPPPPFIFRALELNLHNQLSQSIALTMPAVLHSERKPPPRMCKLPSLKMIEATGSMNEPLHDKVSLVGHQTYSLSLPKLLQKTRKCIGHTHSHNNRRTFHHHHPAVTRSSEAYAGQLAAWSRTCSCSWRRVAFKRKMSHQFLISRPDDSKLFPGYAGHI